MKSVNVAVASDSCTKLNSCSELLVLLYTLSIKLFKRTRHADVTLPAQSRVAGKQSGVSSEFLEAEAVSLFVCFGAVFRWFAVFRCMVVPQQAGDAPAAPGQEDEDDDEPLLLMTTSVMLPQKTPPVTAEQNVLHTFFSHLGHFSYDKAKDNVEREKEANKTAGASWSSMLAALAHLAAAEKAYHSMSFLGQKPGGQSFFGRKDSIRTNYTSLHNELKKVVTTGRNATGGTAPHLEELLSHLSEQLCFFVQARMEIADFYEKMYTLSSQKFVNAEELVNILEAILKKYNSRFHHPILSPLENGFQLEADVLVHLLKAQSLIFEWKFLLSLVNLHNAHTKLQSWGQIFEKQKETKKHLFGGQSQKTMQPPHLFSWLQKFKNILLAKFSFYFHEALSRQTSEMKTLTAKTNPDYFGKISSFIRKYDAVNVSLIFDNRGSESFQGHGYHHPDSYREAPKGVDQYPAVVSLPLERPAVHWPNVIMIMTEKIADLNTLEKVVHFFDDKVQSTYFLTRPEPHFTIVVIFESKKSERDSHFISFLNELSQSLKSSRVYASLKPGSKS